MKLSSSRNGSANAVLAGVFNDVDRPLVEATGLGNDAYTSDAFLELERAHLFSKTWTCIGFGSDVPNPGDSRPVELLGQPLFMLRDKSGEIRVFHNVCSHRGSKLFTAPCKVKKKIVCPYHAWAYDHDGSLFATPHIGGHGVHECDGFDKTKHSLKPVRAATWLDFVFVNLSGDAQPFEQHIEPVAKRFEGLDFGELRFGGADSTWQIELQGNWKLAVENHNDAYHLPTVHPGLNSYSRFQDHFEIMSADFYAGQGSYEYHQRRPEGAPSLPAFSDLPEHWRHRAEYIAMFPNAIFGIHADHVWTVVLEPLRYDRTLERMNLYYVGERALGEDYDVLRGAVRDEWLKIWAEDQDVVERMQQGRASPAFDGGVFSPVLDGPTHSLHRWVTTHLGDAVLVDDAQKSGMN